MANGRGGLLGGGGLFGAARQVAKEAGVPEASKRSGANDVYRVPMGPEDFDSFGATLQSAGDEVELASWEVPAGIARRFGFGRADLDANQGYLYGVLQNASNETISGTVTFMWRSSSGRQTEVNDEAKTEDMNTPNRYDREQQRPYPEDTDKERADPFEELVVKFTPSTPASQITNNYAIDQGASEARWPTTEYDLARPGR